MKKLGVRYFVCFIACIVVIGIVQSPLIEKYIGITIDVHKVCALMSLFLSALLIHVTYLIGTHQNSLQTANIKLALYDKRYKIYEVIDSLTPIFIRMKELKSLPKKVDEKRNVLLAQGRVIVKKLREYVDVEYSKEEYSEVYERMSLSNK